MGVIDESKLNNILPKYDELKLSGKNLAQQYVSAFNTGMNIYQCINQLQGYIEWVIKAVNDVIIQLNETVDSQLKDCINATKQATTEQFNIEWAKNKAQLDVEIEGIIQDQFKINWQEKEDAINLKITGVSNDLSNFKTETDHMFTTTKEDLTSLINTTIDNTINSIYPIGSVYISLNETNPGTYLKGTWEQFGQGRTLIGVGIGNDGINTQVFEVNATGGEYKHKLVIDEIPSHTHKYYSPIVQAVAPSSDSAYGNYNKEYKIDTEAAGGDGYHNNVQPYVTVYFWKRVN